MTSSIIQWKTALGFDFGTRNIGVATGQHVTMTASALPVLKAVNGIPDADAMARLINEWQPDVCIVGMPFNMDGSLSHMALRARKFGNRLSARFNIPWYPVDERLSTKEAKERAFEAGHRGDFASCPVDSLAALILLEYWMNHCNEKM